MGTEGLGCIDGSAWKRENSKGIYQWAGGGWELKWEIRWGQGRGREDRVEGEISEEGQMRGI